MPTVCTTSACGTGSWNGPLPGDPDNSSVLSAVSEFGGIQVSWTLPSANAHAVAYTQIYRSISDVFETAVPITAIAGAGYFDYQAAVVIRPYYYWIQHVSVNGTVLTPIGPAMAVAKPEIDAVIAALAGRVESSSLATSLRDRIDVITDLEAGLTLTNTTLASEDLVLTQQLTALQDELTDAMAYVDEQQTISIANNQALVTSLNTQVSQLSDDLYASIQDEATTRADETGDLFAQKTIKIDLAGNVVGYGLSARVDPSGAFTSDFQVRADTFSIAPPSVSQSTAPANPYNGKIWVDTSVIPSVTRWYNSSASAWQTTPVKGAVPFIVKTTPETIDGYTAPVGVYIDSAYITRLQASQIDTRGLSIKDMAGNVILAAGTSLDWSKVGGTGKPADGATRNVARGEWVVDTLYVQGDSTFKDGNGWACIADHTSTISITPPTLPVSENAYWVLQNIGGTDGVNGKRTAILDMYQWAAAAPTVFPVGSSTYTWDTGQFTAPGTLNGWSLTPPAPVAGQSLWSCRTVFVDSLTSATSSVTWAATAARAIGAPGSTGSPGDNGSRTAVLELYKWASAAPTTFPSGTSTYTWATGAFTSPGTLNGWSLLPGAAVTGQTLWGCSVTYADTGTSATSEASWTTATAYALGAAGTDGLSAVAGVLSNEAHTVPTAFDGSGGVFTGAATTLTIYNGVVDDSVNWTYSVTKSDVTCNEAPTSRTQTVTAMAADTGYVEFTASRATYPNIIKRFTLSKSKGGVLGTPGDPGLPALGISLKATAQAFTYTGIGDPQPAGQSITFTALLQNVTGTVDFTCVGYSSTGVSIGARTLTGSGNSRELSLANFGSAQYCVTTISVGGYTDQVTVVRLKDGAAGANAVVGYLTNESATVAATSLGAVSDWSVAGGVFKVYNGLTDTAGVGVTYSVVSGGTVAVTIASNGAYTVTGITGDAGTATLRAVYSGVTIDKQLTVAKAKSGSAGTNGSAIQVTPNRATTFTATDGALDTPQADIVFSTAVAGVDTPTYVWTFSGFQIAPTNSGTATQTITASQFGAAKSATVTCTVNGAYSDKVTIVRLERNTAAPGATVGAPAGTLVGGVPAENLVTAVNAASNGLVNKLDKAGDTITGRINLAVADGLFAGTDTNNGVYMGSGGIVGKKAGATTFAVDTAGNATFGGALSAATGTFSGTLTADAVNAVNTVNIAGYAVTVPVMSQTYASVAGVTNNTTGTLLASVTMSLDSSFSNAGAGVSIFFGAYISLTVNDTGGSGAWGTPLVSGTSYLRLNRRINGGAWENRYESNPLEANTTVNGVSTHVQDTQSFGFFDEPGAGAVDYELRLLVYCPYGSSFGSASGMASRSSLFALGSKR